MGDLPGSSVLRIVSKEEEAEAIKDLPAMDLLALLQVAAVFCMFWMANMHPIRVGWPTCSRFNPPNCCLYGKSQIHYEAIEIMVIKKSPQAREICRSLHTLPLQYVCRTTTPLLWKRGSDTTLS